VPPAGEESGEDVARDLDALLADAEAKRDEYLDIARRTQADFENYRKRMAAEVQASALRGRIEIAREIVPIVDQFELGLKHEETDSGWALTLRNLHDALKRVGVESVDPNGEKFDPNQHEVLSTIAVEDADSGVVVEVLQKGYRLGDHLIRPARVVVSS